MLDAFIKEVYLGKLFFQAQNWDKQIFLFVIQVEIEIKFTLSLVINSDGKKECLFFIFKYYDFKHGYSKPSIIFW